MPQNAFNPKGRAFVAKDFVYAGESLKLGEPFEHRKLGIIEFDLRGLWLADLISFSTDEDLVEAAAAAAAKELAAKEAARIAALDAEDDALAEASSDAAAAAVRAEMTTPAAQAVTATETPKAKAKAKGASA